MRLLQHDTTLTQPLTDGSQALAERLSNLYVRRDECWLTGEDNIRVQNDIDAIERQYSNLLTPCHLCDQPTVFHEAAYGLPFCWGCLHERYDRWYRSVVYRRNGHSK